MILSLDTLLRTGQLGDLRRGMSKAEVEAILGPPDDVGGGSRKYPQPSILLYGTVEIWFRQPPPRDLTGIWWEAGERGAFRLTPACTIQDWAFTPEWTFERVEAYLNELELAREYRDPPSPDEDATPWIALESGVNLSFNGGRLYGVSA